MLFAGGLRGTCMMVTVVVAGCVGLVETQAVTVLPEAVGVGSGRVTGASQALAEGVHQGQAVVGTKQKCSCCQTCVTVAFRSATPSHNSTLAVHENSRRNF